MKKVSFVDSVVRYQNKRVYFISDTHFGHGNIIKYCNRPFLAEADKAALESNGGTWHSGVWKGDRASNWRITREAIELMDNTIIDNINAIVGENDVLWHLGDFCMFHDRDYNYYYKCRDYRDRIKCRNVNIVWGNHDNWCIRDLFNEAHVKVEIAVNGQAIILDHYAGAIWNKSHRGAWHLYGHSHSQAEKWLNEHMNGRRSFDVGVDYAYQQLGSFRPWFFDEVKEVMADRHGFSMDHHVPKNSTTPEESSTLY